VSFTSATFADANVANGKTVTVSGISLGGTDAGNYSSNTTATTTANITPAALTITANNDSKTYNGAAYSGGNGVTYAGFITGETNTALGGTLSYGGTAQGATNVGTYSLAPSGLTATNYTISFVNGMLTINVATVTGSVTTSLNPSPVGSNVTFTLTLTTAGGTPTGTAQFKANGAAIGGAATLTSGVATVTTAALAHTNFTITAEYAGDTNFTGSTNNLAATQSINTVPTAVNDTLATRENIAVNAAAFKLLLNDTDVDGDVRSLTAITNTSAQGGTISLSGVTVTYRPPTNYSGADSFTYTVSDTLGGTATGTVNVTVNPAVGGPERIVTQTTLPDGNQRLVFAGIPGFSYLVQATTNLSPAVWTNISTNTASGTGLFTYNDLHATNYVTRFYRSQAR
jgi:hypothetical protein